MESDKIMPKNTDNSVHKLRKLTSSARVLTWGQFCTACNKNIHRYKWNHRVKKPIVSDKINASRLLIWINQKAIGWTIRWWYYCYQQIPMRSQQTQEKPCGLLDQRVSIVSFSLRKLDQSQGSMCFGHLLLFMDRLNRRAAFPHQIKPFQVRRRHVRIEIKERHRKADLPDDGDSVSTRRRVSKAWHFKSGWCVAGFVFRGFPDRGAIGVAVFWGVRVILESSLNGGFGDRTLCRLAFQFRVERPFRGRLVKRRAHFERRPLLALNQVSANIQFLVTYCTMFSNILYNV